MPCRIGPRQCRYLHIVSILVFSKFCKIFLMLNGFLSIGLHLFRYWRPHWKNHFQFRVAHRISVGISDQICAEFPNPFSIKIRLKWSEKSDIRWAVPSESVFDMHRHLEINFWSRQLEPWWPPSWRWWTSLMMTITMMWIMRWGMPSPTNIAMFYIVQRAFDPHPVLNVLFGLQLTKKG